MRRINVERYGAEEVQAFIRSAIDLADELSDRDSPAWRAIFRAAYDGYSGRDVHLEVAAPVGFPDLLNSGRR